jgi:hypothetical protein
MPNASICSPWPPAAGHITASLTPRVQRLLDQLEVAVGGYDPAWNLIAWNPLRAALMGDPSARRGSDRNVLWRHFTGQPGRVTHSPEQEAAFEASAVADLRSATARYPDDPNLWRLVADMRAASSRFAALWEARGVGSHQADRKTIEHPDVGPVTLDCDVLTVPGSDLRIVAYTAPPGGDDADRLKLLAVIGTQAMAGRPG